MRKAYNWHWHIRSHDDLRLLASELSKHVVTEYNSRISAIYSPVDNAANRSLS